MTKTKIYNILKIANVSEISKAECSKAYPGKQILDQHMCVDESNGSCFRKTGCPLMQRNIQLVRNIVLNNSEMRVLFISQGLVLLEEKIKKKCQDATPGVRVSHYLDFIKNAMEPKSFQSDGCTCSGS